MVAPVIAGDQTVCVAQDPVAFTVTTPASGNAPITYQWQSSITDCNSGFMDISGETNTTYDPPVSGTTTYYRVITTSGAGNCTNGTCQDTSNCLTITIDTDPMIACNVPGLGSRCQGGRVTVQENGGEAVSWSWSGPDGFTSTNQSNQLFGLSEANEGTYTVTVTDINGCTSTCSRVLTVDPLPDTDVTKPGDSCTDGADLTFTGTPTGGNWVSTVDAAAFSFVGDDATVDVSLATPGTHSAESLEGIIVTLYDCAGTIVGTTTTAADGSYSFDAANTGGAVGAGPLAGETQEKYRVEFSFPTELAYLEPTPVGAQGGSSVQFVEPGDCAYFGAADPGDFCQSNPTITTSCFVDGPYDNPDGGFNDAIIDLNYCVGGNYTDHVLVGEIADVGSVLGLAQYV